MTDTPAIYDRGRPKQEDVNRITALEKIVDGMCPYCDQITRCWKEPITLTVRDILFTRGIDLKTGHLRKCGYK